MTYHELMSEKVFKPAGMEHTVEDDALAIIPHRTAGYGKSESGNLRRAVYRDVSENLPAGGYLSTVTDLVRFAIAFFDDKLVSSKSRKLMLTPSGVPKLIAKDST